MSGYEKLVGVYMSIDSHLYIGRNNENSEGG